MSYTRPNRRFYQKAGTAAERRGRDKIGAYLSPTIMPVILINGLEHTLSGEPSVAEALATLGLADKRVAVERNGEIVPRSLHASQTLREGDRVEIVAAVGGG